MHQNRNEQCEKTRECRAQELPVAHVDADDEACTTMQWYGEQHARYGNVEAADDRVLDVFRCGKTRACSKTVHDQAAHVYHAVFEKDPTDSEILQQLFQEPGSEIGGDEGVRDGGRPEDEREPDGALARHVGADVLTCARQRTAAICANRSTILAHRRHADSAGVLDIRERVLQRRTRTKHRALLFRKLCHRLLGQQRLKDNGGHRSVARNENLRRPRLLRLQLYACGSSIGHQRRVAGLVRSPLGALGDEG
mmetsp:Transcript_6236/g.17851  ORF Transcript_6236/g.17851 Transcript_6236/m.17851 type:complete len:252 (-) Transcript_6236:656-1411(-)